MDTPLDTVTYMYTLIYTSQDKLLQTPLTLIHYTEVVLHGMEVFLIVVDESSNLSLSTLSHTHTHTHTHMHPHTHTHTHTLSHTHTHIHTHTHMHTHMHTHTHTHTHTIMILTEVILQGLDVFLDVADGVLCILQLLNVIGQTFWLRRHPLQDALPVTNISKYFAACQHMFRIFHQSLIHQHTVKCQPLDVICHKNK